MLDLCVHVELILRAALRDERQPNQLLLYFGCHYINVYDRIFKQLHSVSILESLKDRLKLNDLVPSKNLPFLYRLLFVTDLLHPDPLLIVLRVVILVPHVLLLADLKVLHSL